MNCIQRRMYYLQQKKSMRLFALVFFCLISLSTFGQPPVVTEGLRQVNGTSIYVKIIGQGEPILFLHGGPGLSHDYFLPHVEKLAESYTLIFFDQRGGGRSATDLTNDQMTMGYFMGDIRGILEQLNLEKVHVVGHSFGGLLAMKFATENPGKVKSLIFCSSVAGSKEFEGLSAKNQAKATTRSDVKARSTIFASEHFKKGDPGAYELLFKIGFKRSFFDTLNIDKLSLRLNDGFSKTSKLLYGLSPEVIAYDYHSALAKLKVPALVIHGEADLIPIEGSQKLASSIAGTQMVVMKKSGHFPFIEEPQEFIKVVNDFLTTATRTTSEK